jgi:hypothetical protein
MGEYYALIGILFNIKPKPKTKNQSQKNQSARHKAFALFILLTNNHYFNNKRV